MSNNHVSQKEKFEIDDLIKKGYIMISSKGTLDGDVVEFSNRKTSDKRTILLTDPDSRKYFAALYIKHMQQSD